MTIKVFDDDSPVFMRTSAIVRELAKLEAEALSLRGALRQLGDCERHEARVRALSDELDRRVPLC